VAEPSFEVRVDPAVHAVTCRRWNWRQGHRTQLTEHTTRAFFVFDRLDGLTLDELN
jgi:DNA/RNA-binding domain of Phe-tRNA-synthetase-like protein